MAQLIKLSVILLCCLTVVRSLKTDDNKFKDLTQFVLNSFNENPDSLYEYHSAKIINVYIKNDSVPFYFIQLDINASCNSSTDCPQSHIICELIVREDSATNVRSILEDRTKCAKKESEPIFPTNEHGFAEENVSDEFRRIADFAIQQSENNGDTKRSVVDIMSVKRQMVGNGTTLYLTLKVTRTDGGDASLFEVCEAEVNKTGEMALESNLTCFPLSRMLPDAPLSAEDVTAVAERAADELDSLSVSEFTLKLLDVMKAETTVTPGSEGTVTTLELRLAPTLCLKNVDIEGDAYSIYEKRLCPENVSNKRLICSVTSWDRPWLDDTLYSEPSCQQDSQNDETEQIEHTSELVSENQEGNSNAMLNDQVEPDEEIALPSVEHHSIPVVDEHDPIVEQIVSDIEEFQTPVVEEPIVAKHAYCTGCPIDIDVNNPSLQEYVDQAVAVIDEGSHEKYMHKVLRITKAQKQVVNGVKYNLHLEVAETTCLKGSNQDRTSCDPNMNNVKICLVEFLEKPWLDSSREILSNNCTKYNNDLENEIEPHFAHNSNAERQDIFDYLDAMDETESDNARLPSSYGRDGLYLPENEPENHSVESDAEKIDIKNPGGEHVKYGKSKLDESSSEDSQSSDENPQAPSLKLQDNSDESSKSSEENEDSNSERQEEIADKISAYVTGENRNRRETAPHSNVGGLKDINDSEKELVNKLAQIAVQTLDEVDADDTKRVVLEIVDAKKQIVNGVMYHLQLRVVSTSCSETEITKPDCMQDHLSPVKICKVELHRPFTSNSHELDAKVVKSECVAEEGSPSVKKLRQKRSGNSDVVVGGVFPANTSDEYITSMADFATSELDKNTNSLYTQCIVRIVSARKQVVAGYNIHLVLKVTESIHRKGEINNGTCEPNQNSETRICNVTVWDRPWISNSSQVTASSCSSSESNAEGELSTNRDKRESRGLAGAPEEANVTDSYIQDIANTALTRIEASSNALYRQKIVEIKSAKKQVVAGILVKLTLELGYTSCRKGNNENIADCALKTNSSNQICDVEIWDTPWLNKRELTNSSCVPASSSTSRSKRDLSKDQVKGHSDRLVVAVVAANVSDPYIRKIANTALTEIDRRSNALYRQKVVRVVSAEKQVVAGMLIRLTLELGYTSCRKGQVADVGECPLKQNSNNQICNVEVLDKAWISLREVKKISCDSALDTTITTPDIHIQKTLSDKTRRYSDVLVGAPSKANLSDPYIQEMANIALTEVDKRSNALYRQKIVRILEAETQVVAGVLVRLTLELGYSTCRKGHNNNNVTVACKLQENSNNQICHIEILDRPLLKLHKVNSVSCKPSTMNRLQKKSHIGGGSHDIHIGLFEEFLKKYNKQYPNREEYGRRFHIYRANMKKVKHLQKNEQGTAKYGPTQFADLTSKEFKKYHLGLNLNLKVENSIQLQDANIPDVVLPKEFDWRSYNVVTEVKNQGTCGSCWAFSVTGNIEGQWAIKKGKLYSLSEQELVDCDTLDDGCNGGMPENAYKAIESLGGLETENDYPYDGEDEKCHFNKSEVKVTVQGALNLTKNETKMAQWLYKNGPISIGINANAMQFYMGGISHPFKFLCKPDDLDHGVLIVGYGVHKTSIRHRILPYWIVKNSWGRYWGEKGYYRVYRGDGTCGLNQMATTAIVG